MKTPVLGTSGIFWAIPLTTFPAICRLDGKTVEHCHHVTFGRGPLDRNWQAAEGLVFEAGIIADAWSNDIGVQAYAVSLPKNVQCLQQVTQAQQRLGPVQRHLTLFTRQGVKAFASNEMFATHNYATAPPKIGKILLQLGFCPEADVDIESSTSYRKR